MSGLSALWFLLRWVVRRVARLVRPRRARGHTGHTATDAGTLAGQVGAGAGVVT